MEAFMRTWVFSLIGYKNLFIFCALDNLEIRLVCFAAATAEYLTLGINNGRVRGAGRFNCLVSASVLAT